LAGVSFIDAPLHHRNREQWREIISNSGYFFTVDTMRFFDCRVAWDSLTPLGDAWLFITSERSPGGPRRYTVRAWSLEASVVSAGQFQAHDTLAAARREIRGRVFGADATARLTATGWTA